MDGIDDPLYTPAPDPDAGKDKNLWQKLADVMLVVGYIQKRGNYSTEYGGSFKYLKSIDVRKPIREELARRNIILKCSCVKVEQRDVINDKKTTVHTHLALKYTFINGDNPEQREECDWNSWAEGRKAFNAYGGYTSGQRHFLDSFFLLLSGEKDDEEYNEEMEEEERKIKAEDSARNARRLEKEGSKKVPGKGHIPTAEELQDSSQSNKPEMEEHLDESWRDFPLTMADKLCKLYKGKGTVGSIELKHLIQAHDVFVRNVINGVPDYTAPGHQQLANNFISRIIWEEKHGAIKRRIQDNNTVTYDIVKPDQLL